MKLIFSKYFIFLILVFFPFVSFGINNMDTQPWIIIFAIIFFKDVFLIKININIIIFTATLLLIIQLFGFFIYFGVAWFYIIRGISAYFIFTIVYIFQKKNLDNNFIKYENYIFKFNYIYLSVAILQTVISPFLFKYLVNVRTSDARGVTSLTPEPTMFGIFLIFLCLIYSIIYNELNKYKIKRLVILNVIFIVFFAKSATASLYLLLAGVFWFLINIKSIIFFSISFFSAFIYFFKSYLTSFLEESRISYIFNLLFSGEILSLISRDRSIQERLLANLFPFKASFNNYFLPGGFYLEKTLSPIDLNLYDVYFSKFHTGSIIMSLWGSLIAEQGFIFIFLFLLFSVHLFKNYILIDKMIGKRVFFIYIMIIFLGFTSFTISFPLLAFMLATLPILKIRHTK
jgi:hypothetical protein